MSISKITIVTIIVIAFIVGCHPTPKPGEKSDLNDKTKTTIDAAEISRELAKCEEILKWFREQKDCTVKLIEFRPGKIAGYSISWKYGYSKPPERTRRGDTIIIKHGSSVSGNRSVDWFYNFGNYESAKNSYKKLKEIQEDFKDDKDKFGLKKVKSN